MNSTETIHVALDVTSIASTATKEIKFVYIEKKFLRRITRKQVL